MKSIIEKSKGIISDPKEVRKFLIIFYVVGFLGFVIPYTYPLFVKLIPYALLLNTFLLVLHHPDKKDVKLLIILIFVFISSFLIEMFGVASGKIFGSYNYGNGLGIKINDTPLIIGLNWALLVYLSTSVAEMLKIRGIVGVLFSSVAMVLYDFVIERVAPKTDMWYWGNDIVPLQNFITWFALALIFNAIMKVAKVKTENKLAPVVLLSQFLFFIALLIFFELKQ